MKIDILTLFPEMIEQGLSYSIPGRGQKSGLVKVRPVFLRNFGVDKHGNVDDSPYGGGPGMILRVDVADRALEAADPGHQAWRIMMSPDGEEFNQDMAKKFSKRDHLVILCGRYEGFDARIEKLVDQKISVGPYVLSGGELPAMTIVDAVSRLIPGVLGNEESLKSETHEDGTTDYPQYTRPDEYKGEGVPEILKNGHHAEIAKWRASQQKQIVD